jgi:hypothetical protein
VPGGDRSIRVVDSQVEGFGRHWVPGHASRKANLLEEARGALIPANAGGPGGLDPRLAILRLGGAEIPVLPELPGRRYFP